ncbi:MAG: ParB N-terminal domain-containing protein, partial [Actinobacteria bacterium]|nr:ParB N-terminal domain-containing protein [Actinomycetota bacterium]
MAIIAQRYATVKVTDVQPHPDNPNVGNVEAIAESIEANGFYGALLVQESTGNILAGSHRWQAARTGGEPELPALLIDCDDATARRILVGDNAIGRLAAWNEAQLVELLRGMSADPGGLRGTGITDAGLMRMAAKLHRADGQRVSLADQFMAAPFDVLDGRGGWWGNRKRQWLALGIRSEEGRFGGEGSPAFKGGWMRGDAQRHGTRQLQEQTIGRKLTAEEIAAEGHGTQAASVFDPVLCELACRWFSPPGGAVIDPFAGGSVRGIVAAVLGRAYAGCELSARQVAANVEQAAEILPGCAAPGSARWDTGDSQAWRLTAKSADLLFTCPPYYDTEVYSDDPRDLSAMAPEEFDRAMAVILQRCTVALRPDRFAVIVTGDSRDKRTGQMRDLRGRVIAVAEAGGLRYMAGAVHVTPSWSLAVSAARQFKGRRTLGRMHDDVLVFCKGDPGRAAKACGPVEVTMGPDASGAP